MTDFRKNPNYWNCRKNLVHFQNRKCWSYRNYRNRQVRKMCAAAGLEVRRLVRIAEGELSLGGLQTGKWRHLTSEELDWLLKLS